MSSSRCERWRSYSAAYIRLRCTSKAGVRFTVSLTRKEQTLVAMSVLGTKYSLASHTLCSEGVTCQTGYCTASLVPHPRKGGIWGRDYGTALSDEMTTQPKGRISVRLTCWNHRWLTNRLPYLAALMERHFVFTEKLVDEAVINLMLRRVSCKGRHCSKESRRSQGCGICGTCPAGYSS